MRTFNADVQTCAALAESGDPELSGQSPVVVEVDHFQVRELGKMHTYRRLAGTFFCQCADPRVGRRHTIPPCGSGFASGC
jgi:hypothetical protein